MSIDVMTLVWKFAPYEGNTLLTLLALADWSNDDGVSWPSLDTLAKKCRQSKRNVMRCLDRLEEDGCLVITRRQDTSSLYKINLRKCHLWTRSHPTPLKSINEPDLQSSCNNPQVVENGCNKTQMSPYTLGDTSIEPSSSLSSDLQKSEPTTESTPTPTPSSDREIASQAMADRQERLRLADQHKAEKDANKGRGLRHKQYDRKPVTPFPAKESNTEIRARKNAELLSGLNLTDGVREALGDAGEAFKQDLTLGMVKLWKSDLKPFPDELIVAAFAEFRRRDVQWFPRQGEIIAILERMVKESSPTETAIQRFNRESRERRERNAKEAAGA